jgi:hypothetical protein
VLWQVKPVRDITMDGLWRPPQDPDSKIAGTVSVNDEDQHPTLRLIGAFFQTEPQPRVGSHITGPEQHEMLHGQCEDKPAHHVAAIAARAAPPDLAPRIAPPS